MLNIQKKLSNSFFALISLPATAMGFALSIQISALSWLMRTKYNLDLHEIGIVWAAGPLAGIIGQPIVGLISDNVWFWKGRRRPFILIGGSLAALMLLALPNIGGISNFFGLSNILFVAVTVALTLDLAINISFNPTRSIIADVTPEGRNRTRGYTWMQTISGSFGVLAYAIGAFWGNILLIYFGVGLVMFFSIFPLFFIEEPRSLQVADNSNDTTNTKTNWPQFLMLLFAHSFSWLGIQTMFVYIIGFIEQKLFPSSSQETGQIISVSFLVLNAVGAILPALLLEPLSRKHGRVKTHLMAVATMAIAYFLMASMATTKYSLWILMGLAGIGWAAVVSLPFAIMSEKVNKQRMGFFMGIFNLSVVIPQLISSLVLGTVISFAENKSLIFLIAGFSLSVSAILWCFVKEGEKPNSYIIKQQH